MTKPQTGKSKPIFLSLLFLIAIGVVVWMFFLPPSGKFVTELYQYYPQDTAVFVEVAPGEKMAGRFLRGIDKLRSLSDKEPGHGDINMEVLFQKDFEPQMSFGSWVPKTKEGTAAGNPGFLMVVPLRQGVTIEKVAQDLHSNLADFEQIKADGATIYESRGNKHPAMAIHGKYLLSANNADTIKLAIAEKKTPQTVGDNPLYKNNIGLLPQKRQGTFLALSQDFDSLQQPLGPQPGLNKVKAFQQQMKAVTPVIVGSIKVEGEQKIAIDTFTPIDLSKAKDNQLRKDIGTLFEQQANFDMPKYLPEGTLAYGGFAGLAKYFDLYLNNMATENEKMSMQNFGNQLKMLGLDLRKNIISLFDGRAAIGIFSQPGGTPDFLVFLNGNADTQKTFEQFGVMAAQMTQGVLTDTKIDDKRTLKVLNSPKLPIKVGYSNLQPDTLVLGTQQSLEKMYSVEQKKEPSLNENKLYKELSAGIPSKASSLFFIDVKQGATLLDQLSQKAAQAPALPGQPVPTPPPANMRLKNVLSDIEGVIGVNEVEPGKMVKGHLVVKLADERAASATVPAPAVGPPMPAAAEHAPEVGAPAPGAETTAPQPPQQAQ